MTNWEIIWWIGITLIFIAIGLLYRRQKQKVEEGDTISEFDSF